MRLFFSKLNLRGKIYSARNAKKKTKKKKGKIAESIQNPNLPLSYYFHLNTRQFILFSKSFTLPFLKLFPITNSHKIAYTNYPSSQLSRYPELFSINSPSSTIPRPQGRNDPSRTRSNLDPMDPSISSRRRNAEMTNAKAVYSFKVGIGYGQATRISANLQLYPVN